MFALNLQSDFIGKYFVKIGLICIWEIKKICNIQECETTCYHITTVWILFLFVLYNKKKKTHYEKKVLSSQQFH